jgi:hypothetical protein
MRLADEIARAIETALAAFRFPGNQISGEVSASNLPPTGNTGSGYTPASHTHDVADLEQSGAVDGDVLTYDNGAGEWVPAAPTGGGVSDGDKGDVVVSGSGTVWTLDTSGVSAATYGSATQVSEITVDAKGRITSALNRAIALAASAITSGLLGLARGGTNADLSATGGSGQYVKQSSAGAALTVGTIASGDLPSTADTNARVGVRKNSAGSTFTRRRLNLIEGSNVTITVADDSGDEEVDVTIAGTAGAPTTAKYLTTAADGTLSAEVVIPGLAGSVDVQGTFGAGTAREFESGDTAPTWTPSSPATTDVGTTYASHLYIQSTDATERFGYYAWTPGSGAFQAIMRLEFGNRAGTGGSLDFVIGDSANTSRVLIDVFFNARVMTITAYTYASSTFTQRGSTWLNTGGPLLLIIARDGSNNISFWWSTDGKAWNAIATQSFTFTVAKIGVRSANAAHEAAIDYIRTNV